MKDRDEIRGALTGPVASVSTPFTRDGDIDFAALRAMVDFIIAGGSSTVLLTNGDSLYTLLTDDEVAEVTRVVAEHAAGRALVVAADRAWATPKEVAFAKYAGEVGADMLMVLCPDWAQSCTMDTLVEHYAAVTDAIPVMLVTNWLAPRSMDFSMTFIAALRDRVPGVMAIKDDLCGTFARKMSIVAHERMAVLSGGQKQNHMNNLPYGCDGYLSTFGRFKPEVARKYWHAVQTADSDAAARVIRDCDIPLFDFIIPFRGGFDAAIHGILELAGIAPRWRRRPYHSLDDGDMERLGAFLKARSWL
jgi:dihydrodipicolinate synthase/N-acetylneuraminate lyase